MSMTENITPELTIQHHIEALKAALPDAKLTVIARFEDEAREKNSFIISEDEVEHLIDLLIHSVDDEELAAKERKG